MQPQLHWRTIAGVSGTRIRIGTAGWAIPRAAAEYFPAAGTHLQRYASSLNCVEINSSFYRSHRHETYVRWAETTPEDFRYAVKMPRLITHDQQLRRPRVALERFLGETSGLGGRRGPVLVQLPPSHAFDARVAGRFFGHVRERYAGPLVCEPRHPSWFSPAVDRLLQRFMVARAAADPAVAPGAERPGGWKGLAYFRLHGSPRMYWSRYSPADVTALAHTLGQASVETWCVFDNTAAGGAIENALEVQRHLQR